MSLNEENNLKEEEKFGGFDVGVTGDETFLLKSEDEYSGILPDLGFEDGETNPLLVQDGEYDSPNPENDSDEADDIPPISQENNLDDEPFAQSIPNENYDESLDLSMGENIESGEVGESVWDLFKEDKDDEGFVPPVEDIQPVEEISETPGEDINPVDSSEIENEEPIEEIPEVEEETIRLDEDLRAMIEQDILKPKKSVIISDKEPVEYESDDTVEDFPVIDESTGATYIDLTTIDADHPSTYGMSESKAPAEQPIEPEPPPVPPPPPEPKENMRMAPMKKEPAVRPDEKGIVKEKKKRAIPWVPIGIAVAAIVLLGAIGIGSYMYFYSPWRKQIPKKESVQKKDTLKISKPQLVVKDTVNKPDTLPVQKVDTIEKHELTYIDSKPAKIIPEKKPKTVDNFIKPVKKVDKSIAKDTTNKKQIKTEKIGKDVKAQLPKVKTNNKEKNSKTEIKKEGLFVVQVYATPSKDDADDWLKRLRNKNIGDAFITTQKIRDVIWYRVRFGSFKSREDARSSAVKYGFPQSWIDRVR